MMKTETWKIIPSCQFYEASDRGRIRRSDDSPRRRRAKPDGVLRPYFHPRLGRHMVNLLHNDGKHKTRYVHRLVAEAFIGPCPIGLEVNHIDGDKGNNASCNLEYVTRSENILHAYRNGMISTAGISRNKGAKNPSCRLSPTQAFSIRHQHKLFIDALSKSYGVTAGHIQSIIQRRTWKDV